MNIRDAEIHDAQAIAGIYNHYVVHSHATFEVDPIDVEEMKRRIDNSLSRGLPFLVAEIDIKITGYAYAQPYKQRAAYQHSVEISVYVDPDAIENGIGTALYEILFARLNASGVHAVIAGISLPNDASVRLHEGFGLTKVAHFLEVGRKFDRWIDVGYWELVLKDTSI
ncbi:MAG TPA: GNAT family N-acetyltransferase [Pyrinomonadaceae bacterium]|jgi:phosphinothricin acetyltransferase